MHVRSMRAADAEAVAAVYNEGIRGRGATSQTRERSAADVASWRPRQRCGPLERSL